jgi:membrane protein YdbS with pleckstrin-like domain
VLLLGGDFTEGLVMGSTPENEKELTELVKSPLSQAPLICAVVLLAIASVLFSAYFEKSVQYISVLGLFAVPIPLSAIFPLVLLGMLLHRLGNERYLIGPSYIRMVSGLLSLRKKDILIENRHIHGIEVHRGPLGRLLNIGDVEIGSVLPSAEVIRLKGLYDPSAIRDLIQSRLALKTETKKQ